MAEKVNSQRKSNLKAKKVKNDEDDDWDVSEGEIAPKTKKSMKEMTEREREEEIFRRMEEQEVRESRLEISKSLKRRSRSDNLSEDELFEDWDDQSPKKLKVSDIFGDDEEEEVEVKQPSDDEVSELSQIESIRVSRYRLEKWMYMPFFIKRVVGFLVRVNVGTKNSRPVYKIAQIVGIKNQDTPYIVEKFKTDKVLRLSIADQEKTFKMSYISNHPFTDEEFNAWVAEYRKTSKPLLPMSEINEKLEDYKFCETYSLTESDINSVVREKQRFADPPKNQKQSRSSLLNDLVLIILTQDEAIYYGDESKKMEIEKKLKDLESSKPDNIPNPINDQINREKRLQELNERERLVSEEMASNNTSEFDPFIRRRTLPTQIQIVSSSTLKAETKKRLIEERFNPIIKKPVVEEIKKEEPVEELPIIPDVPNIRQLHDFELDINIDL